MLLFFYYYYIRGVFPKRVGEGGYFSNLTIRVGLVQIFELERNVFTGEMGFWWKYPLLYYAPFDT